MNNRSSDDNISSIDQITTVVSTPGSSFHEDSSELEIPEGTPTSELSQTSAPVSRMENTIAQPIGSKMPELAVDCLDSRAQLTNELDRIYQVFKSNKSLPSGNQPYAGDIHKQRQALSRALVDRLKSCKKPDTYKLELANVAIQHEVFDNRTLRGAKNLLTSAVRMFWSADNPTPVMPAQSQMSLLAYRNELVDQMKADKTPRLV